MCIEMHCYLQSELVGEEVSLDIGISRTEEIEAIEIQEGGCKGCCQIL